MRSRTLLVLGVALFAGGCAQDRQLQQDLVDYKNETGLTLQLLHSHDDFLTAKLDRVRGDIEGAQEGSRRFQRNFDAYSRRPDEIKLEILEEVDARANIVQQQQDDFRERMLGRLNDLHDGLTDHRTLEIDRMQATLDQGDTFFRFVFTSQDSVNQVFAARFDKKPWYQSVLGRWEEEAPKSSPPSN